MSLKHKRKSPPPSAGDKHREASPTQAAPLNSAALSKPRRWFFGAVISVVIPVVLVCSVEIILRLAGYGHPTSFFLPKTINGKEALVENPWFGLRFFPPALARSPSPVSVSARKGPGVYRIFLFGESAALGDPRPAFGVGRYLEALLRAKYPGTEFEVVCTAMTAINSHAILPIARECARYDGDLWIVYMGNNEYPGPFGANTVFGAQAPPACAVRAYLALESTRLGQWLVNCARGLRVGRATPSAWRGMKMFMQQQLPPQDPRRVRVQRNFRENLKALVKTAERAHVPVILSSVASNLKDCPPFGSYGAGDLNQRSDSGNSTTQVPSVQASAPSFNSAELPKLVSAAETESAQSNYSQAVHDFTKTLELNPYSAEIHFRLGECFLASTNFSAARQSFAQARDLDTLPFRADSKLNGLVAEEARQESQGGQAVYYVDAEQALAPLSQSGIPGSESFYEHVHLNCEGNYRLALSFAKQAAKCLPAGVTNRQTNEWLAPDACGARLALTDWNRYTILEEILRRMSEPPFAGQINHDAQLNTITNLMRQLRARMTRPAVEQARAIYKEALERRSDDQWLHHNYAEFLTAIGDLPGAAEQMQRVCELIPENYNGYFQLGRLLARQKKYDEARSCLETALRLIPDVFDVRVELGQVCMAQGKLDEALAQYADARGARAGDEARLDLLEANVFARQQKPAQAIDSLREAIRLRPDYWEAHELLGINLALEQQYPAAQTEFEAVVRLRPAYAEGHLNLGIALARQKHFDQALDHFETTLRLDPQNERAQQFVSTLRQMADQKAAP